MSARAAFKQADVTRLVKAFAKAGVAVTGGRLNPDGSIVVLTSEDAANDVNPLDRVLRQ